MAQFHIHVFDDKGNKINQETSVKVTDIIGSILPLPFAENKKQFTILEVYAGKCALATFFRKLGANAYVMDMNLNVDDYVNFDERYKRCYTNEIMKKIIDLNVNYVHFGQPCRYWTQLNTSNGMVRLSHRPFPCLRDRILTPTSHRQGARCTRWGDIKKRRRRRPTRYRKMI